MLAVNTYSTVFDFVYSIATTFKVHIMLRNNLSFWNGYLAVKNFYILPNWHPITCCTTNAQQWYKIHTLTLIRSTLAGCFCKKWLHLFAHMQKIIEIGVTTEHEELQPRAYKLWIPAHDTLLEVCVGGTPPIREKTLTCPSNEQLDTIAGFRGHHWTSKLHWFPVGSSYTT